MPRREDGSLALNRPIEFQPLGPGLVGVGIMAVPVDSGPAIPGYCLRTLDSPIDQECNPDCIGVQEDGSCLCDIVRAARAAGVEWSFEIDERTGQWVYNGEPL